MALDEFKDRLGHIEDLVQRIESSPESEIRNNALELAQSVMELHGAGLNRIMEAAFEAGEAGAVFVDALARDKLISSLLLLHNLHPDDLETRVTRALDSVRPYLKSHGGNLEFLGIEDGRVRLRFQGSCRSCPASALTAKGVIEAAIFENAPDIVAVEVEGISHGSIPPKEISMQIGEENNSIVSTPLGNGLDRERSSI